MKTSMLEYSKVILEKVSFSRSLFKKEYRKFRAILTEREGNDLRNWSKENLLLK